MSTRVVSILGTRPEIVKFSPLLPLLDKTGSHTLVHTGQHYDSSLDAQFFHDLDLRKPQFNLGVGSHPPSKQIALMIEKLGDVFQKIRPNTVLVLGDTNSTLAGAIAGIKSGARVVHIESGCRSFRLKSPEEENRILVDHISSLHFAPDTIAKKNLAKENIRNSVFVTGSLGLEALSRTKHLKRGEISFEDQPYAVATLHRAENTENKEVLERKLHLVGVVAKTMPVFFPIHPRTAHYLNEWKITLPKGVVALPPLGYLEFLGYLENAHCVLSDSGGIQEEAALLKVPCLILRDETEWMSYVKEKRNFLVGDSVTKLKKALMSLPQAKAVAEKRPVKVPAASSLMLKIMKKKGFL